jgi:hypothetical protein
LISFFNRQLINLGQLPYSPDFAIYVTWEIENNLLPEGQDLVE